MENVEKGQLVITPGGLEGVVQATQARDFETERRIPGHCVVFVPAYGREGVYAVSDLEPVTA